jgi:DNA-binding response OmpR family regulator
MADGVQKILLVEDEPLLANLLKQRLEREGFTVSVARDGEEGLRLLQEDGFSVLLLDIILPKISGFELMETMRSDPQLEKTPVIIISNLGQESDVARGESLGAAAYFVKAKVSIDELIEEVKKFLSSRA